MKFEGFNKKYRDGKKDNVWKYCREAMVIMKNSKDQVHDHRHIENIFGQLDRVLKDQKKLKVDYDVLALSVCWHDCWKASSKHGGFLNLMYRQLAEGIAGARMFKKRFKNSSLPSKTVKAVSYSIRKHSQLQFLPTRTLEAKLLIDADRIEMVNYQRIINTHLENTYFESRRIINLMILYTRFKRKRLNFEFNKLQYDIFKEEFLDYLRNKL